MGDEPRGAGAGLSVCIRTRPAAPGSGGPARPATRHALRARRRPAVPCRSLDEPSTRASTRASPTRRCGRSTTTPSAPSTFEPDWWETYVRGQRALRRGRRRRGEPRAPSSGCTTTSSSWSRRCCASCAPTCGSASSSTSRSRPPSCSPAALARAGPRGPPRRRRQSASSARLAAENFRGLPPQRLLDAPAADCPGSTARTAAAMRGRRRSRSPSTPSEFDALARHARAVPSRRARAASGASSPTRVLLGVDRLDYTKGIVDRLEAFERPAASEDRGCAAGHRPRAGRRAEPRAARALRATSAARSSNSSARINGEFGQLGYPSCTTCTRACRSRSSSPLYQAADVMLVTPLRDGMNLVAKEYVAVAHRRRRRAGAAASSPARPTS